VVCCGLIAATSKTSSTCSRIERSYKLLEVAIATNSMPTPPSSKGAFSKLHYKFS
jgi:hypothetical protein